jgi:hypothetical protein
MSKFGFLKRTHIPAGEAGYRWMNLPEVGPGAGILVANATQENVSMLEEAIRTADDNKSDRGGGDFAAKLEKGQDEDRVLLHKHLLKGWREMYEIAEDGKPVLDEHGDPTPIPFSGENAWDFVSQIPGWVLTRIKLWCMNPENFVLGGPQPLPDANSLGN